MKTTDSRQKGDNPGVPKVLSENLVMHQVTTSSAFIQGPRDVERRIGRFRISTQLMRDWRRLLPVFENFAVVRCEMHWDLAAFEYEAYSELFDEIGDHEIAPNYELLLTTGPGGVLQSINARRLA